jgi:hypothetical protein
MRTFLAVPWLSPSGRTLLISLMSSLLLVFGAFALLRINSDGKRVPQELVTGSIQRSPSVRRSASNDPMAAFPGHALCCTVDAVDGAEGSERSIAHSVAQATPEQALRSRRRARPHEAFARSWQFRRWRVEYFDDDGGCYVTAFAGPTPSKGSADYFHSLKLELALSVCPRTY